MIKFDTFPFKSGRCKPFSHEEPPCHHVAYRHICVYSPVSTLRRFGVHLLHKCTGYTLPAIGFWHFYMTYVRNDFTLGSTQLNLEFRTCPLQPPDSHLAAGLTIGRFSQIVIPNTPLFLAKSQRDCRYIRMQQHATG